MSSQENLKNLAKSGGLLSLAALRKQGYRPENRFTVFQSLEHTSDLSKTQIRILVDAHANRNRAVYDGDVNLSEKSVEAVIEITQQLLNSL